MYVIDVSSNNGPHVPWQGLRDHHGIHGGIVKATEGTNYENPDFPRDWKTLKQLGMERGGYLWAHAGTSATATIDYHMSYVRAHGGYQPRECLFVDFEQSDGFDRAHCDAWLAEAEAHADVVAANLTMGVYASNYFLEWLGVHNGPWNDYKVWVASYGSPPTITNWYGHQFTDSYAGSFDCSIFPRGLTPLPAPPPPHPESPMTPALWNVMLHFIHTHYAPQYWAKVWTMETSNPQNAYAVLHSHKLV
jgi:GH25 family lysozyme M1 (1,4-beta-N-acetylmuramidase)